MLGTTNLTTAKTTKIAPTVGISIVNKENSGIERKTNPAASTKPIPLGKNGARSSIEIIMNKTNKGINAI